MKTTLTKDDPVGWYAVDYVSPAGAGLTNTSFWWDGEFLRHGEGHPRWTSDLKEFTNFRLLLEAPAEYHTIHQRAEQFLSEFAQNPVSDTLAVFSKHLKEHLAGLLHQNQEKREKIEDLNEQISDLKAEARRNLAEAKFYETQMSETAAIAAAHGWIAGSSLAEWLKDNMELVGLASPLDLSSTDQFIGTQDTSDEIPGLGDGDDTWEEPDLDDRYEIASDDETAILKRVPDSPGEWHHCGGQILRVWESEPTPGRTVLKGQYVDESRSTAAQGAPVETFRTTTPSWVKAVPPVDANCDAMKTLRELTAAIHAVCDEAEIPAYQPKMARVHIPDPLPVRDRLQSLKQKIITDHDDRTVFCCPKCNGTHFGTPNATLPFSQWVRRCHDQYGVGCRWEGKDKDCIFKAKDAAERLANALAKREAKLKAIGRIVWPVNGASVVDGVQALADGFKTTQDEIREFRRQVNEAAKPENPAEVIATIKALRAQRDQLRTDMKEIVDAAHAAGWNGVENSKILSTFIRSLATPQPNVIEGSRIDPAEFRERVFRWLDKYRPWATTPGWSTNVYPAMHRIADAARELITGGCPGDLIDPPKPDLILLRMTHRGGKRAWALPLNGQKYYQLTDGQTINSEHVEVVTRAAA